MHRGTNVKKKWNEKKLIAYVYFPDFFPEKFFFVFLVKINK